MNASIAGPGPEPLLFSWEPPRRRQIAISTFLALSLIAHALCFYVFQIIYPTTVSLLPPPARVSVISSDSEEGRTLLRWIDAEDPALAFTTQRPPEARLRALPKVEHIPSYLAVELALKQVPLPVVDLHIPSSQPPGVSIRASLKVLRDERWSYRSSQCLYTSAAKEAQNTGLKTGHYMLLGCSCDGLVRWPRRVSSFHRVRKFKTRN